MPEGPEICRLSEIIDENLNGCTLVNVDFISGKYKNSVPVGFNNFRHNLPLKLNKCDSCGKFLYLDFGNNSIWFNLGLFGFLKCVKDKVQEEREEEKEKKDHLRVIFNFENTNKKIKLCFYDRISYGIIRFSNDKDELLEHIYKLKPDMLKDDNLLLHRILNINNNIVSILMSQDFGSGLGNYLTCEILYDAKINPKKCGIDLTKKELAMLEYSIKYKTKLAYQRNSLGYWEEHKDVMTPGKIDYHPEIQLDDNDVFQFNVYKQKIDFLGNEVSQDNFYDKRTTYWVKNIQKN